jgi:asparagine synthase (glutamine-hydrolysing)
MCGICGLLQLQPGAHADRDAVTAMCATLRHRGPDDEGVVVDGAAGLGATRLAIIDVAGGHQPVASEDGTIRAVQNGEIYNFAALRDELAAAGHRFASHSDTEVLVHLYEDEGPDFARRLRGMFAVAIWDGRARRLVLARDRLGIKPLFYALTPDAFLFGSEIKAILAAGIPRRLDAVALHDYLSFDYVPGPRTMFDGIARLPAGHVLVLSPGTAPAVTSYWDFPPQPAPGDPTRHASPADLKAELARRLEEAVRVTMVSDVPVGAFLSGGLDSSIVVALMSRVSPQPVRTFSVGFRERSYNELPYARRVAERFGTAHTELVVEPDVGNVIHRLVDAFDEPFADSSAVAAWAVSEAAAGRTKVVLSGDGGDEVFGGYVIYQADRLAGMYRRLPHWLGARAIPALVDRLPASQEKMSLDLKLRRFVAHARRDPGSAHAGWRAIFTDEMKARLYAPGFRAAGHDSLGVMRAVFDAYPGADTLNRFLVTDARVSLVDDMLTKVDRTSMAHSLEVRVPLLDHELVEWMTRLPSRHKVRGLTLKHLLKAVARDLLPAVIVDRPKAGFHVPVPVWLRRELRPLVDQQLGRATIARQGVFDPREVDRLVAEHMSARREHSRNLWGLLMFGLWYDRHLERL